MSVESVKSNKISINSAANKKVRIVKQNPYVSSQAQNLPNKQQVAFKGALPAPNPVVGLMDFIEAGGYPLSFILQDGTGFILPRVGKGLLRGGKKKRDENGNEILDKNGNPKRELNWAFARKEFLREIITGPSAFVIPLLSLQAIKKYGGRGNNIRTDYIDGFKNAFTEFAKNNSDAIMNSNADKKPFYTEVFKNVIDKSINSHLPEAEKMSDKEILKIAEQYAEKQVDVDKVTAKFPGLLDFRKRNAALAELGSSIQDDFMKLKKQKIGSNVNEMAIEFLSSDGQKIKHGSITELTDAMSDYFDDAVKNVHNALKKDAKAGIESAVKHFTNRRIGSRIFTNVGLFSLVALFYTQIPRIYNMGTNGVDPALANEDDEPALQKNTAANSSQSASATTKKDVTFGGNMATVFEHTGSKLFNNKHTKYWSDIFELNGATITGTAMSILLYVFCIPPRLFNAQSKYDFSEIFVRDVTAFTALLYGAKALQRLFSDGFSKLTGLALNNKNMEGKNTFQKIIAYLNPSNTSHSVLTSRELDSKYTHLEDYKGGINGFMDFIEKSGGNIKKAFAQDKKVKAVVEEILQTKGKSYALATAAEIKAALSEAHLNKTDLIKKFYGLFNGEGAFTEFVEKNGDNLKKAISKDKKIKDVVNEILRSKGKVFGLVTSTEIKEALNEAHLNKTDLIKKLYKQFEGKNGLLNHAKTCNSAFGALSTLVLVPGLIISLTDICKYMTDKRIAKEKELARSMARTQPQQIPLSPSNKPTMAGFLNR